MGILHRNLASPRQTAHHRGRPRYRRTERHGTNVYEVYAGGDAEAAREFLLSRTVTEPLYYVVVESTDGVWGLDQKGLYLERLRPWQTDTAAADCDARSATIRGIGSVSMAARGIADNFMSTVECGRCGHRWPDGVRYQDVTLVRCPACGRKNAVDTHHIVIVA